MACRKKRERGCLYFGVSTGALGCLERLVSEMIYYISELIYYMSSGKLNSAHLDKTNVDYNCGSQEAGLVKHRMY